MVLSFGRMGHTTLDNLLTTPSQEKELCSTLTGTYLLGSGRTRPSQDRGSISSRRVSASSTYLITQYHSGIPGGDYSGGLSSGAFEGEGQFNILHPDDDWEHFKGQYEGGLRKTGSYNLASGDTYEGNITGKE